MVESSSESPDEEEEAPKGPKNKKGRPFGHGATNATRREKRAHLQWSALEKADPGSPRTLMKHLEALEEAKKRAQQRLAEQIEKRKKGLEKSPSRAAPAKAKAKARSSTPRGKPGQGQGLEKPRAAQGLEKPSGSKDRARSLKGGHAWRGKDGSKRPNKRHLFHQDDAEVSSFEEEWPDLEKSAKAKTSKDQSSKGLEKPKKQHTHKEQPKASKGMEEPAEKSSKGLEKPEEKSCKGLEKPKAVLKSNKDVEAAGSKATSSYLESENSQVWKKPGKATRPVVVVDWHEVLEVDEHVSKENLQALDLLLEKVEVILLSYVVQASRVARLAQDIKQMLPQHGRLFGKEVCYAKTGEKGKCALACRWQAIAIFDDNRSICQESLDWGLQIYPIRSRHQDHRWIGASYSTFAEAVLKFLSVTQTSRNGLEKPSSLEKLLWQSSCGPVAWGLEKPRHSRSLGLRKSCPRVAGRTSWHGSSCHRFVIYHV